MSTMQTTTASSTYSTPSSANTQQLIAAILHARIFLPPARPVFDELRTRMVEDYVKAILRT